MPIPVWQPGTLYNPGALVVPATPPPTVQIAPDNPDFEDGATGWTLTPLMSIGQYGAAFQGTWSLQLNGSPDGIASNDNVVPVVPGQVINAHCYFRRSSGGSGAAGGSMNIEFYDSGMGSLGVQFGSVAQGNGGFDWRGSQVTATAPAGAAFARMIITMYRNSGSPTLWADSASWDYTYANAPPGTVYKAVQADAGFSGSAEPVWPTVIGNTVVDNQVTWQAVVTSRVVWEATPVMKSGATEPVWSTVVGDNIADNTVAWRATSRRITDPKCPNSRIVAIAASKVFAGDDDIIAYCATTNPLDWSKVDDAGYLPYGLQTHGANPVAAMGLYRSNLVAFNGDGFQMWQVDQDPVNMAFLDAVPTGSTYQQALQPLANDLLFLSAVGMRNVSIAGASTNLQADGVGEPIDPLVKAAIAAGAYAPTSLYWPAAGQYWLIFGPEAFVLTINKAKQKSWSRYVFPEAITDATLSGAELYLRTDGDHVWHVTTDEVDDDVYPDPPPVTIVLLGMGAE